MVYRPKITFEERFWRNVERRGVDECWPWKRFTQPSGHGRLTRYIDGRPVGRQAHRIAWELTSGPIPEGQVVRHRCDNPPCCNPAHLQLGTQLDNIADTVSRGRNVFPVLRGERHPGAKITAAQVERIRERRADGLTLRKIATEFGIGPSQVARICSRESWAA